MEYHNTSKNEDLFKHFTKSIKQNDLLSLNAIKQRLTKDEELTAYFTLQLQTNASCINDPVTLLYYAIHYQNYTCAKILLELRADPDEISGMILQSNSSQPQTSSSILNVNKKNYSVSLEREEVPLVLAALRKNWDLVYLLISFGADPIIYDVTTRSKDIFLREAQQFVLQVRDEWIKASLKNTIDNSNITPSILCAEPNNTSEQLSLSSKPSI